MNIKKIVSAITAFALSATMFAGFSVTASAAAGDVTTNATADFTSGMGDFVSDFSISSSNAGWLSVGNGSGTVTIADEELAGSTDKVTVKFKVAYGKLSGKNFYYNIKDSNDTEIVSWSFCPYNSVISTNVLGTGSDLPTTSEFYYSYNTPLVARAADLTFVFDFAAGTVTQTTVNMNNGDSASHTNNLPEGVTDVKTLTIGSNYNNPDRYCVIDDISITTTEGENLTYRTLSLNYVTEDEVAIPSEDLPVGTVSSVKVLDGTTEYTPEYPTTWTTATHRYAFKSSDTEFPMTVSADADITFTYTKTELPEYSFSVNTTINETPITLDTATAKEGKTYSLAVSKYYQVDDVWYETTGFDGNFGKTGTASQDESFNVEYTPVLETIIDFKEMDNTSSNVAYSNGSAGSLGGTNENIAEYTLDSGVYSVVLNVVGNGGTGKNYRGEEILLNDTQVATITGNINGDRESTIVVPEDGGNLVIRGTGTNQATDIIDYVLVTKVSDAPVLTLSTAEVSSDVPTSGTVTADLVAEDNVALETATEDVSVSLDNVVTLYIKVDDAVNGVVPTVTLADEAKTEIIPVNAQASTINDATYYVYQFVGFDTIAGATIDYAGVTKTVE